jgi:hypothetical protein
LPALIREQIVWNTDGRIHQYHFVVQNCTIKWYIE